MFCGFCVRLLPRFGRNAPTPWEFDSHALGGSLPRLGSLTPTPWEFDSQPLWELNSQPLWEFLCRKIQYQSTWYFQYQSLVLRVPLGGKIIHESIRESFMSIRVQNKSFV